VMLLIIGFGFRWIPFEPGVHAKNIRNVKGEENPNSPPLETFMRGRKASGTKSTPLAPPRTLTPRPIESCSRPVDR
jgi:hypothetical protein